MIFIIVLLVIVGLAVRATSAEERAQFLQRLQGDLGRLKETAGRSRPERERFRDALRARTRWPLATPALAATSAAVFLLMRNAGAAGDPQTLIAWGANIAPRTTNGEWWRLLTSMFLHAGLLQLLINIAGLVQVGAIAERLAGRFAVAGVYITSGVFAALVSLWTRPVAVSFGASGAVFGVYGFLLVLGIRGVFHRSDLTMPLPIVTRLAPAIAIFVLYNAFDDSLDAAALLTGFVVGLISGLAAARHVDERTPESREMAIALAAAAAIAAAVAFPLRGIADVKPEIARVVALEDRTADRYRAAISQQKSGRMSADALARLIDESILPELQSALAHLKTLERVPEEQHALVADAEEYLRLRCESWRLRAHALRKANRPAARGGRNVEPVLGGSGRLQAEAQYRADTMALGRAEGAERAALVALEKIKAPDAPATSNRGT